MFGMKTFNAVHASGDEGRNDVVCAIQSGMGHDSEATGLMDQFDGFESGNF